MAQYQKNDQFAQIAATGVITAKDGLTEPQPPKLQIRDLPLEAYRKEAAVSFPDKMTTKEELYKELAKQKEYYRPFLSRKAPTAPDFRTRIPLKTFQWRIETDSDKHDFTSVLRGEGDWETVTIPHFGAPLGKAVTYYRTKFNIKRLQKKEALFLRFDGVDYKAHVFLNNCFLGSHEGFFAPFEFDCTGCAKAGENTLVVKVENDFVMKRNELEPGGEMLGGDKLYAATGPGYNDPVMGWHHCPPGMGIYQDVTAEIRPRTFISDLFIRPLPEQNQAEAWVEAFQCNAGYTDVKFSLSLYGRNFNETVFENLPYEPVTGCAVGLGDTFTQAQLEASGKAGKPVPLYMEKGGNLFKIPFDIKSFRWWSPESPYLYELQVSLLTGDSKVIDTKVQSFGMRSFSMDTEHEPKGTFYLNGRQIRLRGANTMGHGQQCVINGDDSQLLNDLLLAKICNMNFLRLTQRPVQEKIYEYCDAIGLLTQTDLPLFGVLRRTQFAEAVRQAEEMERLVRRHPCNILDTYINEPFPNANNQPHRQLIRSELMQFFKAADVLVKYTNPDRVTKHADGDYDPPCESLPDNHCYTAWYNGQGVDLGALHKGYWLPIKPGWNCGCGEFGAEGLDFVDLMRRRYPREWLPQNSEEEKNWSPNQIRAAQSGNFHYFFYGTPHTLRDWVEESQAHQAWAAAWMTEAFRRNSRMVTFAIHLFIDAFPAGWMKAVMDCERNPKPAYFAYRDALSPQLISLRTDRLSRFTGEQADAEVWVCNDKPDPLPAASLYYEVLLNGRQALQGSFSLDIPASSAAYYGSIRFLTPQEEGTVTVKCALLSSDGKVLHSSLLALAVKQREPVSKSPVCILGSSGTAAALADEMGLRTCALEDAPVILIDDRQAYDRAKQQVDEKVFAGAKAVFLSLPTGSYSLCGTEAHVKTSGMLPLSFVSCQTGHPMVKGFGKRDFSLWYSKKLDRISPILERTFTCAAMNPILLSGNTNEKGEWGPAQAAGEAACGKGKVILCELDLAGRTQHNPAAWNFASRLVKPL